MSQIIDDYLNEVRRALRASAQKKDQIVRELRSHLEEKVMHLRHADPERELDAIERQVIRDFGSPTDLALAYDDGETVIQNEAGETLLRIGKATARGAGTVLKWTAVTLGVLLVLGIGVGVWAFYEVRPYVEDIVAENLERDAYEFHESCQDSPCTFSRTDSPFYVDAAARELRVDVDLWDNRVGEGAGTFTLVITDPFGAEAYNRTFTLDQRSHAGETVRLQPTPGTWRVDVGAAGLLGSAGVHVVTVGTDRI